MPRVRAIAYRHRLLGNDLVCLLTLCARIHALLYAARRILPARVP